MYMSTIIYCLGTGKIIIVSQQGAHLQMGAICQPDDEVSPDKKNQKAKREKQETNFSNYFHHFCNLITQYRGGEKEGSCYIILL